MIDRVKKIKILFVFGTRPEAIKMAPVINRFQEEKKHFDVCVCSTGQHKEMLDQVINFFNIKVNHNLRLMVKNQSIAGLSSNILISLDKIIKMEKPDYIFVHGDTTTTAFASIAAFYNQTKICHIEAGLRTFDKYAPFPEEINRSITTKLADFHFAPTKEAKMNLVKENISENSIVVTGNTVIDALLKGIQKLDNYKSKQIISLQNKVNFEKKIVLVTGHRRENFGVGLKNICDAIIKIANRNDIEIIYPVHLNPNVKSIVKKTLSNKSNIHLIKPLNYPEFIWLMNKSHIILTDSGGIQEEAPSIGIPILVMRDKTERPEGIKSNTAILVGTEKEKIIYETTRLLTNEKFYKKITLNKNPYGDGKSSEKIFKFFMEKINE